MGQAAVTAEAHARTAITFEQIRAAADLREQWVEVPEWSGAVLVRGLTRAEGHEAQERATVDDEITAINLDIELLRIGVIEPKLDASAWEELVRTKSAQSIRRVVDAILGQSSMTPDAVAEAERTFRGKAGPRA